MRIAARFVIALAASATAACSNPKCWTHDSSEVEGGCSVFGGSGRSSSSSSSVDYGPANEKQLDEYGPGCERGEPIACWMVGAALTRLERSWDRAEAAFAVACRAGFRTPPAGNQEVCDLAASAAWTSQRPDAQARMRDYYTLGCRHGAGASCRSLFDLPGAPPSLELAEAACHLGVGAGCRAAVARIGATDRDRSYAFAVEGCAVGEQTLCATVGLRAVTP